MSETNWHRPFSPLILETTVPKDFINIINKIGDEVLSDENKSAQWDWSNHLVGKVHKEIQIPISNKEDSDYCKDVIKLGCVTYLQQLVKDKRAFIGDSAILHNNQGGSSTVKEDNINISQTWIVSQYKHENNPWNQHSGDLSGVIYLKIPKDMNKFYEEESKDHYPCSGMIQFMHGEKQSLRSDTLTFKPEVGKMLIFPSWLKHSVFPFYVDGERRCMSFNAYYVNKK